MGRRLIGYCRLLSVLKRSEIETIPPTPQTKMPLSINESCSKPEMPCESKNKFWQNKEQKNESRQR